MKQIILCLFLICALDSFSQKGFLTVAGTGHFADLLGSGFGAEATGNGKIFTGTYLGFGVGASKYANLTRGYFPFTGRVSFIPSKNFKNNIAIVNAQAGYGLLSKEGENSNGGPIFGASIGVASQTKGHARFYGSVGYLSVGLKGMTPSIDVFGNPTYSNKMKYYGGLQIKAGLMLY